MFMGFKAITDFKIELPSNIFENQMENSGIEEYIDTSDFDIDDSNYNDVDDAFYSGEYLPKDW